MHAKKTTEKYRGAIERFRTYASEMEIDIDVIDADLPTIISQFMMQRFEVEGLSYSTVELVNLIYIFKIHASALDYYANTHQRHETSPWDSEQCLGNPVNSDLVLKIKRVYQKQSKNDIVRRSHPLSYKDMEKITNWINSDSCIWTLLEKQKYDALFAVTWFCWMRIDEVEKLQNKDLIGK